MYRRGVFEYSKGFVLNEQCLNAWRLWLHWKGNYYISITRQGRQRKRVNINEEGENNKRKNKLN